MFDVVLRHACEMADPISVLDYKIYQSLEQFSSPCKFRIERIDGCWKFQELQDTELAQEQPLLSLIFVAQYEITEEYPSRVINVRAGVDQVWFVLADSEKIRWLNSCHVCDICTIIKTALQDCKNIDQYESDAEDILPRPKQQLNAHFNCSRIQKKNYFCELMNCDEQSSG